MIELKIDPEFRDKIPAMPTEDFNGLRNDIINDGYVRDPLVVWKEENILLDGHHRWRVIQDNEELLGDKFTVDYKSFPDRWAAIAWICANQLHKHNLNDMQRIKLLQEEYDARKKTRGGDHKSEEFKNQSERNAHIDNPKAPKLREEMMAKHHVGPREMQTAVAVGRGIDRAAEVDPEFKREVLSGEIKAKKSDLAEIRKMSNDEDVKEAIEVIRDPGKKKPRPMSPQMKDFTKKMLDVVDDMETAGKPYELDDAICELNGAEDVFLTQIRFILEERKDVVATDERGREQIIGFIESVIHDLNELKGEI